MSIKNLLKDEILNLIALSGRGDRAWEDELWLSRLWPVFRLLFFGLEGGVDSSKGKGLVGSLLCIGCSGSGPHSPLENLPVLPVKNTSAFILYSPSPQRRICRAGAPQARHSYTQISVFT